MLEKIRFAFGNSIVLQVHCRHKPYHVVSLYLIRGCKEESYIVIQDFYITAYKCSLFPQNKRIFTKLGEFILRNSPNVSTDGLKGVVIL